MWVPVETAPPPNAHELHSLSPPSPTLLLRFAHRDSHSPLLSLSSEYLLHPWRFRAAAPSGSRRAAAGSQGTILGKRKGDGDDIDEIPSKKPKCPPPPPRNRASPSSLLLACKDMPQDRQDAIDEMDFTSLQNIKCGHLSNGLNVWLAGLDDLESREVVVPGRGRLPVKEEYVHRVMGVPRGGKDIPYNIPTKADIKLGLDMFGEFGYTHKMTELLDLITSSDNSDTNFKRMWLMLAGNTVIAPTTSKKVNPRWYVVLRNIDDVKNLNWSKFIADEPHKAVSKGKPTKGCILFYNVSATAFLCFPFVILFFTFLCCCLCVS
ncbi:uncharacterized protein [Triticum aestivum]|uniref:uncharacterized protein n=1 Tax=Triticum aestivum TaxID=4565 RepID=UPI001D023F58|nr:uncharacterized protein LOC123082184 [Triticum aestivum]